MDAEWARTVEDDIARERTAMRLVDESRVYRNRLWCALKTTTDALEAAHQALGDAAYHRELEAGRAALANSEPPPAPADARPGDICQCPDCGRAHRSLGAGRPPAR